MIAAVSEAMQTEIVGGAVAITVAGIGAGVQLWKLRRENREQHDDGQRRVADAVEGLKAHVDERFDAGDRRFGHLEREIAELRARTWWRR